jgi:hypothetical protein
MMSVFTRSEARALTRRRLATWPVIDAATERYLRGLHWRVRQAVVCVHGERLSVERTAARLGVSERTVYYDLALADAQLQGAASPEPLPDLADVGLRRLAAAVLLQAWRDAVDGSTHAPGARSWLRDSAWAGALCDELDLDRDVMVERMNAELRKRAGP